MFDTMTLTKIVGALCGAFLVFLLGKWAAETIYFGGEGAHGEHEAAYSIEIADAGGTEEAVEEGPAFADLFAAADVAKGEKLYGQCKACHKLDGTEGTGPHLNGIVGRAVGSVAGFTYTAGVAEHGGNWDPETLNAWLTSPKTYIAGTKMTYAGMKKPEDRANLIAWLATVQ
jgi:cytochrome c